MDSSSPPNPSGPSLSSTASPANGSGMGAPTPAPGPEPAGRNGRGSPAELFVAGLFAAVVALLFAGNAAVEPPASSTEPEPSRRLDLRLQAQYELGIRHLFAGDAAPGFDPLGLEEESARRLDALASTARERIALAPVLALLAADPAEGDERAREILASLADDRSLDEPVRGHAEALLGLYQQPPAMPGPEQREELLATYGWFAQLALDRLGDGASPALERARTVTLVLLGTFATLLLVLACGICAAILLLQRLVQGRLASGYAADTTHAEQPRLPYLETALLFLVALTLLGAASSVAADAFGSQWFLLLNWLIVPVLLWPTVRGRSAGDLKAALGWHRGSGLFAEAGCGLLGYLAAMPLLALGLLLTLVVTRFTEQTPHHPIVDWLSEAGTGDLVVVFVLAVVWAPLVEESLFRGSLYHYLRGRLGILGAGLTVSLAFAAIHPQGVAGIPFLGALAVSLALIREWRGSIIASVTLHMVHNGVATLTLVFLLSP